MKEKTGYIRGRGRYSIITLFNDPQPFGEKSVARKLTRLGGDVTRMDITVDTLEPATDANESIFRVAGAKPVFTSADEDGRFTQPGAVYAAKPTLPGWHGKVTCDLNIDEHGHVRGVELKDTMDDAIIKPIREALMNWEYAPATINGHPSLGYVHVNVE